MTGHHVESGVVVVAGGGLALHDGVFGVEVGGFAEGFDADAERGLFVTEGLGER